MGGTKHHIKFKSSNIKKTNKTILNIETFTQQINNHNKIVFNKDQILLNYIIESILYSLTVLRNVCAM